jgi:hypothetical protein
MKMLKLKFHSLAVYFTVLVFVSTTLINDGFFVTSITGIIFIILVINRFRPSNVAISIGLLSIFISYLFLIQQDANLNLIIFHMNAGFASLIVINILACNQRFIVGNEFNAILILSICMSILQFYQLIPSMHWPRISGIFTSPNQFAAFCFLYMYVVRKRKIMILVLSILTQSSSLIPAVLLSFASQVFKGKNFRILAYLLLLSAVILLHSLDYNLLAKYLYFYESLNNFYAENNVGDVPRTVYTRVNYLIVSLQEITSIELYLQLRSFEFREGFLLTLTSINPGIALIVLGCSLTLLAKFIKEGMYALAFITLMWAFVVPIFEPIFLLLLLNRKK